MPARPVRMGTTEDVPARRGVAWAPGIPSRLGIPPALAKPLLDVDPGALKCDASGPGTIPPPCSVPPPRHHPGQPGH